MEVPAYSFKSKCDQKTSYFKTGDGKTVQGVLSKMMLHFGVQGGVVTCMRYLGHYAWHLVTCNELSYENQCQARISLGLAYDFVSRARKSSL
jgi:hypothetical protein